MSTRAFTIRVAPIHRTEMLYRFHAENVGKYLWAREPDQFKSLIEDGYVYEVLETTNGTELAGICYIKDSELGGIYLVEPCRGIGLGTIFCQVAISHHCVSVRPKESLIAHVHELNPEPRPLLSRLGFAQQKDQVKLDGNAPGAPPNMPRNDKGLIVGDEFKFSVPKLRDFADWFERFDGTVDLRTSWRLEIELDYVKPAYRDGFIKALRALAEGQ